MANNPNAKDNLKPFVKGDPRINRKGRPKSFDAWRKLNRDVLGEIAINRKTGEPIIIETVKVIQSGPRKGEQVIERHYATNAEVMIRSMMRDKKYMQKIADAAFGTVAQKTDINFDGDINVTLK